MRRVKLGQKPHPKDGAWAVVKGMMRHVYSVVDIGPGVRPQSLVRAKIHTCVEPHPEYFEQLDAHEEFVSLNMTGKAYLGLANQVDTVVMLDVIEHMTKEDGLEVLELAKDIALEQIVVYTPNGFREQKTGVHDKWGYPGTHWQDHISGWTPDDFHGWAIVHDGGMFFAIWDRHNEQ